MAKFYAVKKGNKPGIYHSWDECKKQVEGFSGAVYKSFKTLSEAKEFIEEKPKTSFEDGLIAYVDGSFNIKTKEYGYGCVIIAGGSVIKQIYGKGNNPEYVTMRNVSGEILGSIAAMKYALENNYKNIAIYYDYMGIEKWANQEWKANKEGTINYVKTVQDFKKHLNIHFIKVLAHSGDTYNDLADQLAKKAVGVK